MSWLPDWLTGLDRDNVAAGDAATAQLAVLNAQTKDKYAAKYGDEFADDWYAQVKEHEAISLSASADPDEQVEGAFWEGWNEGAAGIRNGIGSTINTTVGSAFKIVPWQVWVIALLFAAFRLGLLKGVLGKFKSA